MRIVHAADLHLDSPLRGLSRYEGAPVEEVRRATRRAFENLVNLCIEEGAALLLLAGDLFDGDWRDYSTGLFFVAELSRLRQAGVRVAIVRGNHDAKSRITKSLSLPDNVYEFGTRAPETVRYDDLGVALHGQSFGARHVPEDLAARYPAPLPDLLNIGLLHTSADGRPGHEPYAPCSLQTLIDRGYDYWALGHVHAREVLCESPYVVFPGNLQGRHARETGEKGATLIEVETGRIVRVVHRPLDVVRFERLRVDVSECAALDDVLEQVREALSGALDAADGRLLAARVVLLGACSAHAELVGRSERLVAELRALCSDLERGRVWVEKVELQTRSPIPLDELMTRDDAIGQLLGSLGSLRELDDGQLSSLAQSLAPLRRALPRELREDEDGDAFDSPRALRAALSDLEPLLLDCLLRGEGAG